MKTKPTLLALVLLLSGCASRKVDHKEKKQKIDFTEQTTEETKTNTEITTKVIDTSTIDEIEIIPVDITKPIEYNGHKVINGTLKLSKRKNAITTNSNEKVSQIAKKEGKTELKAVTSNKDKQTTKPDSPIVSTWKNVWVILELSFYILLLLAIYFFYKKYVKPRLDIKNNSLS
jgi:hypothetical protein